MVALSDSAEEMYGKIMSWNDGLIIPAFELCTYISMVELENIAKEMAEGTNPRDLKMKLAYSITSIYHGDKKAKDAGINFTKTFQKSEIPQDVTEIKTEKDTLLVDVFLNNNLVSSKTEFRRLVDEHAITNLDTNEKVTDYIFKSTNGTYRIGKKRFCKIIVSN
jgi:tyrosyl-tRNA synthetase